VSRPTIGVYTCVLNEAVHVERWADSARCADHLLMLDTGSHDSTPELARACGIEVHSALIDPFRFDDARNIAMALIPPHIDIVIQLDADEVFDEPNWRRHIDANADHDRWSYWLNSGGASWGMVRRSNCVRRSGFRWEHPIHEVISGPEATCHLDGLVITHKPDKHKDRSYTLGMLEHFSAADPGDARTLFYLGREYKYRGKWAEGRTALWRYVNHPKATWGPERSEAYMLIAEMSDDPFTWLWKAVAECPTRREPFVAMAHLHSKAEDFHAAHAMLVVAAGLHDMPYTTHTDAWGLPFETFVHSVEAML